MQDKSNRKMGTEDHIDVFGLIKSGALPEYLCHIWKRVTGIDPRIAKKIFGMQKIIAGCLFIIGLSSTAVLVNYLSTKKDMIPGVNSMMVAPVPVICLLCMACFARWGEVLEEKYVGKFEKAITALLSAHPMTKEEFPNDENGLKYAYWALMIDMARFVLVLESKEFRGAASIARIHLKCINDGACDFMYAARVGLKPWFALAETAELYLIFDETDWTKRYNARGYAEKIPIIVRQTGPET